MTSPTPAGADLALLRRINTSAVLRVLRGADSMTLSQIGKGTSLSRQTADAVIGELADDGWIEEVAPERGIGRPARRYRFRAEAGHVLGIDVGTTGLRLVLADLDGNVIAADAPDLPPALGGTARMDAVHAAARTFLEGQSAVRLRALGLAVPGIVDAHGRIRLSVPLPEWNGLDLAGLAHDWFGCPAHVDNDANLAALAEHWLGAARHVGDFIQLIVGHRTGAGMMLGGRLHRGRGGAAGEIGALAVLGWEGSAVNDIREAADSGAIFAAAKAGDAAARERVDRFAQTLAQGIAAMVLTVNPDLVVIGGGLAQAGEAMVDPIRSHLDRICLDPPRVDASALGPEAVALGAARLALDHLNEELFGSAPAATATGSSTAGRQARPLNTGAFRAPQRT
ncbi:ROK family transcriptional regulator [Kitasatospora cineracea]|uniref:NBD/HSP70 family sugar kinase n=1 Tax=Kitasatospora cineracea TaxID=88074 RepID=A0A3N4RS07_9ACTN|nr:ROK family transcriptional regulator [Kitasatospora cineracea]RPE36163.1 putative NBD/HSP70 family sugar kinase [Kitasatospora cineracea]